MSSTFINERAEVVYDVWVELSSGSRYPVVEYSQFVVLNYVPTFA